MYYSCTVVGSDIVAWDNPERLFFHFDEAVLSILAFEHLFGMLLRVPINILWSLWLNLHAWLYPRHQLFILHAHEFCSCIFRHHFVWDDLVAVLVILQRHFTALLFQVCSETVFRHDDHNFLVRIRVVGLDDTICVCRTYAQSRVRGQSPRCCCPCCEISLSPLTPLFLRFSHLKECCSSGVFHVAIASWLIQLVRRQSCSCSRRIWLYGISFVEQPLVIELFQ